MEEKILEIIKRNTEGDIAAKEITSLFMAFSRWLFFGDHPFVLGLESWYEKIKTNQEIFYTTEELFKYWLKTIE